MDDKEDEHLEEFVFMVQSQSMELLVIDDYYSSEGRIG
jgi:hypothetical protein